MNDESVPCGPYDYLEHLRLSDQDQLAAQETDWSKCPHEGVCRFDFGCDGCCHRKPPPDYVGAIAAIKELHQLRYDHHFRKGGHFKDCTGCHQEWPCPTIQALGRYGCD